MINTTARHPSRLPAASSRTRTALLTAGVGAVLLGGAVASADPPETLQLVGVVRDFRERTAASGHTDFERRPDRGFGLYCGNVATLLGEDGKPVFTGAGSLIKTQWHDSAGRPIAWTLFDASRGDLPGMTNGLSTGGITSAESFSQWFRDVPGVNLSMPVTLTFNRQADGSYVFDDKSDPAYQSLGGFFPIEHQLLGNPGGSPDRNFHFTFELNTEFTYHADGNQVFKFIGDDDVWVFIDRRLVIDLGGVHGATEQYVDLNRLGLEDGQTYRLDFFFAERHRTQSNFRVQTNLLLQTPRLPQVTAAFD